MSYDPVYELKILDKRITPEMLKPSTEGSAAIDLYACVTEPIVIMPNEFTLIASGIAVYRDTVHIAGLVIPRSGLGHKFGLVCGNSVGLIDPDYQGQIMISAWNRHAHNRIVIHPMDKIAQLLFVPIIHPDFRVVKQFSNETNRGQGGFGSTG